MGRGSAGLPCIIHRRPCHSRELQYGAIPCCDVESRTRGPSSQSPGCQTHYAQDVRSRGHARVLGRDLSWWRLRRTLIPRQVQAAVSDWMQTCIPVCQALSDCDWHIYCWQYKENLAVLLDMRLFASRQHAGWEWNVGFCSRCASAWEFFFFLNPLENSPGSFWLTASTEVLSSKHVNLLAAGTRVVYRRGLRPRVWWFFRALGSLCCHSLYIWVLHWPNGHCLPRAGN